MDLSLAKKNLENKVSKEMETFGAETKFVFQNSVLYNDENTDLVIMAITMLELFTNEYTVVVGATWNLSFVSVQY